MRLLAAACSLLVFLSGGGAAAQEVMSHEETMIRTAYAKLSYAVDINTAYRLAQSNPGINPNELIRQVNLKGLRFLLSDFKVGNLADIADAEYTDMFDQYPDGQDVIYARVETETYSEAGGASAQMETARAEWGSGPEGTAPHRTVRQMIPALEQESGIPDIAPLQRYCSYGVTATFAGRSVSYRAAFLFGANGKARPDDVVVGVGGGSLFHFLLHPAYPVAFLRTRMGDNPAVRYFLTSNQRTGASCTSGDACCDAETLQCGVLSTDLAAELGRQR
jgi:hypothetical protein